MDKPEINTVAKVPQLKAIIESESFLKEINCKKKKEEKSKKKKKR